MCYVKKTRLAVLGIGALMLMVAGQAWAMGEGLHVIQGGPAYFNVGVEPLTLLEWFRVLGIAVTRRCRRLI
jgi:hypothetical protein